MKFIVSILMQTSATSNFILLILNSNFLVYFKNTVCFIACFFSFGIPGMQNNKMNRIDI